MARLTYIYHQLLQQLDIAPPNRRVDTLWLIFWTIAALVLYTWQLGHLPLRDWDEGIVAIVAREISRASDLTPWLFPTNLDHTPYWNKPPLIHWLIAFTYKIAGINEWSTRLPSACLSALSVPLLYIFSRELLYHRLPAIFATGVYLTYLPMLRQGRLAMLDGAIVGFLLFTFTCILKSRRDRRWGMGIGIGLGLMCLTKGLLGLLLGTIGLLFLAIDTRRVLRSGHFWTGLLLGMAPVGVWYGAQYAHYGSPFIQAHFFHQVVDRIGQSVENNGQPAWFYLLEILKYGTIWLVFLPLGIRLAWRDRHLSGSKLIGLWGGGYLLLISLMQTKLPWYAMPLYPAIAILSGRALADLWSPQPKFCQSGLRLPYRRIWIGSFSLLLIAVGAGLLVYTRIFPNLYLAVICLSLALTFVTAIALLWQRDRQFILVLIWGMYITLIALVSSPHWIWELAEQYEVKPVAALVQAHTPAHQPVYTTFPVFRPALDFYSDRRVIPTTGEFLQQLYQQGQPWTALLPDPLPSVLFPPASLPGIQITAHIPGWTIVQALPNPPVPPNSAKLKTP